LLAAATVGLAPSGRAAGAQIEDPKGDHPVPFMDLTSVSLELAQAKGGQVLRVQFTTAGPLTPEGRTFMTGYSLRSKVNKCNLLVRFMGYPDGVFAAAGDAVARCEGGRDVGGTFKINENTIAVDIPMRDLKGVAPGMVMTELRAATSPGEGMYHDDTTAPAAAGDAASSNKPWTIG
jgi:hypothetical protein